MIVQVTKIIVVGGLAILGGGAALAAYMNPVASSDDTALATSAMQTSAEGQSSSLAVTEKATCLLDNNLPAPCKVVFDKQADGQDIVTLDIDGKTIVFTGMHQGEWWSGELAGKPAMGYERNRGNVVFSARDLTMTLQYWTQGNEHGSY